jgi:hypothetical protein
VSIYDPIFTKEDHLLFEELNMKVTTDKACVFLPNPPPPPPNLTLNAQGGRIDALIFVSSFRMKFLII